MKSGRKDRCAKCGVELSIRESVNLCFICDNPPISAVTELEDYKRGCWGEAIYREDK